MQSDGSRSDAAICLKREHAGLTQIASSNNVNVTQTKLQWTRLNALIAKKQGSSTQVPFTPNAQVDNGPLAEGWGRPLCLELK